MICKKKVSGLLEQRQVMDGLLHIKVHNGMSNG